MIRFTHTAAVVAFALMSAPVAYASGAEIDAATKAKITVELTAQGYDVRKIDSEDGRIEVYAVKDGKTVELYLNADLKIVETKTE